MADKLLITVRYEEDAARVRGTGAGVLAEYPEALLVRVTADQARAVERAGLEAAPVEAARVLQTATARFRLADAAAADAAAPLALDPGRTAYFIVQLAGPVAVGWLEAVRSDGVVMHEVLPGYRLLVGMPPRRVAELRAEPFVEQVVCYRPAMKLSPRLRADVADGEPLPAGALERVDASAFARRAAWQVQVTVFDGERADLMADRVRAGGGVVLSVSGDTMVARVPRELLVALAGDQAVEAILPHGFPRLANDRATAVIGVPRDRMVGATPLTGAGQVIGIADGGIDTGDPATLHPDLRGRVTIVSSPNQVAGLQANGAPLVADGVPADDGAADEDGHGTHVAGSVAGNGAAARAAGAAAVPTGVAPEAHLHFTAVAHRVVWNPAVFAPGPAPAAYGLYGVPADLGRLLWPAYAAGARVHLDSWGNAVDDGTAGTYPAAARDVDAFMFTHRDMLVVFAAGNAGRDRDGDGHIDPDSIGPPGTAKNCLTVGACENDRPSWSIPPPGNDRAWAETFGERFAAAGHVSDNPDGLALTSSRGPTDDGRIKPEVVAPGTNVLSVRSAAYDPAYIGAPDGRPPLWGEVRPDGDPLAGRYCWGGGSSMAAPFAAGIAALVRQHLLQRGHHHDGVAPSGALLKAFLVNGAQPLTGQYPGEVQVGVPDNAAGFGRVNLTGSVAPPPLGAAIFSDDPALALASGQTRRFRVAVPDRPLPFHAGPAAGWPGGPPLMVTLTWTDPPGAPGTGGLHNLLYLQVVLPGGTVVDGDVTPFPLAANNTQRVVVPAPTAGVYEVRVRAVSVVTRSAAPGAPPGAVQDFALVVSGAGYPPTSAKPA